MRGVPWLELTILAPLCGALLGLVLQRAVAVLALVSSLSTAVASAGVAVLVARHGTIRRSVGAWELPLGIQLRADGLAALVLVAFAVVGVFITAYAMVHFEPGSRAARSFFPLWLFAWTGLDALLLSSDVFNLYVTLELTTLTSVGLVATGGDPAALSSALRYLLFAMAGSLLYLLGVALLYGAHGVLDLDLLGAVVTRGPVTWGALALITCGLALKAPLFPLHGWLPAAYASAPVPVSALLSGVVGKCSLYVLVRIWLGVFGVPLGRAPAVLIGVLGAAGVLWASIVACRQQRLKLLVAYSSIAQLGTIFLVFPLMGRAAFAGGAYLVISHACAAAAMFIAAGTIEQVVGHDEIDRLDGLAHRLPLTFVAFALAGVSAMGMPPSGGFVAKWLLVRTAFELHEWWWAAVILIGGLLSAAYVFRVLRGAFVPAPITETIRRSRASDLLALGLALLALALGLAPDLPLALAAQGAPS